MGIERDLFDLLHEHDCVIVPEWGGFLAQYRPARLDEGRRLIHPPGKTVGFNRHLLRNDGLLADRLATREGLDHATASARIAAEVLAWRSALDSEGRKELGRIGVFYRDSERNLQFEPDERANFLKEAFGLRPVAANAILEHGPSPLPRIVPPVEQNEVAANGRPWLWAAAVGAVLVGSAAIWGLLTLGQGGSFASLPWKIAPAPTYVMDTTPVAPLTSEASVFSLPEEPLGITTLPLTENDSVELTVDLGSAPEVAVRDTTRVVVPAKAPRDVRARFHVIGGCFAQPENADRLLQDLKGKGYPAVRLERYGELHPVAFGSYVDRSAALEALSAVRASSSAQAWLLVR